MKDKKCLILVNIVDGVMERLGEGQQEGDDQDDEEDSDNESMKSEEEKK